MTKQWLYKIQPVRPDMLHAGPTKKEQELISKHFSYLKDLTGKGVVILAGRTLNTDKTGFGIIIFQAETEEAARRIVNNDPAVTNKVMKAELYPYSVALLSEKISL
jgi:uncharacterized protein YciI